MMVKLKIYFAILFVIVLNGGLKAQNNSAWPVVTKEMKPWTRWWWMGSAVDKENISAALNEYEKVGFGGVEITPIYGAKGYENKYIPFLSPEWMKMLEFSVEKANYLGLGVDMNLGTGWPYGGPQVTKEYAAAKMIVQRYELKKGERLKEKVIVRETKQTGAQLQLLRAIDNAGNQTDLMKFLTVDGVLNWSPKNSDVHILAFFNGKTKQMVKRAAPGGEGFTLDHLDRKSVNAYLNRFDNELKKNHPGVRSFFNDSYEVYGANWTQGFFEEFRLIKGYDLKDHVEELTDQVPPSDKMARIKSDYREVMSDLLQKSFLDEFTRFSRSYNALSRNQAHGSPGNLIDLYAATDIAECETFGASAFQIPGLRRDTADIRAVDPDPMMFKFATSATNTQGKKYTSAETFTWLTEHFKTSLSQAKPEVEQLFLSGVNHVFYHGTTYSPKDVEYPGWLFYASVNFTPSNSLWPHLTGLNQYVTRVQSVLQTTRGDNEILVYWPVYDVWHDSGALLKPLGVHNVDKWLHPTEFYKQSVSLTEKGYSFDYATDQIVKNANVINGDISTNKEATPYKILVVPQATLMPDETFANLIELAEGGATIIFQALPQDVPGFSNLEQRRQKLKQLIASLKFEGDKLKISKIGAGKILLAADLHEALQFSELSREKIVDKGLKFLRRVSENDTYYYIVNHSKNDIDDYIPINRNGEEIVLMDPQTGYSGLVDKRLSDGRIESRLQLKSGQAIFVKVAGKKANLKNWVYLASKVKVIPLDRPWELSFERGGLQNPTSRKLTELRSWTELEDPATDKFSGTGIYETSFNLKMGKQYEYILDLGSVAESARIWINGHDAGYSWSIPFELRVGQYLKNGTNTIKIEVNNLMSNRIKDMDQRGIQWRNYHEINFVNINYKAFNAKDWKLMPSGLLGPVKIKVYKKR